MKRKIVWFVVIIIAIVITSQYISQTFPSVVVKETKVEVDTLSPKIEQLKDEVLLALRSCESQGFVEDDGLIIFDSNNKASIGLYQFQKSTVIHYYKTLYNKDITGKEAIIIALDEQLSKDLAQDIIFKDTKGIDNWFNCKNKKGLAENIKWIKKLNS